MSMTAEKVAEVLALPEEDRAYLARRLIASLGPSAETDAEAEWLDAINRRSREIEEGRVRCRPVQETLREARSQIHVHRQPS